MTLAQNRRAPSNGSDNPFGEPAHHKQGIGFRGQVRSISADLQATNRVQAAQGRDAAFPGLTSDLTSSSETLTAELAVSHFLRHIQNELAVPFFHLPKQAAKLVE